MADVDFCEQNNWIVLRCSGPSTLALAQSLTEAGFDVWSPLGIVTERSTPSRTRRDVQCAMMPSYVFARASAMGDLLALSHAPSLLFRVWDADQRKMVVKGHPHFRVFRGGNHRPIPDEQLALLRRAERKAKPMMPAQSFVPGDVVRSNDGGFAGLTGIVTAVSGKMVKVRFDGWDISPTFAAWLLTPVLDETAKVHVNATASEQGAAKKAA